MFTTFPVKPRTPTTDVFEPYRPRSPMSPRSPKPLHRVAHIYQARSPTRPVAARTQPERPAPILTLPGLPPQELPRSVVTPQKKKFGEDWVEHGRSWLAQFRPPWSEPAPNISVIPPVTPKTAKFVNDEEHAYSSKSAKFPQEHGYGYGNHKVLPSEDDYIRDPPPLYKKHAPEGGLNGWLSVAGAFLIQFCTIGYIFTWNVFENQYNHVVLTDQNPIAVRLIGSVQFFLAFFLSLVAGKLADSGFFRHTVHGGSFLFALSLLLLSFVGEEEFGKIFATQSLGMGIGVGLVFVPTALVPLHYFKRRKGMALGIVMSGGSFGAMIFPPVLRHLMRHSGMNVAVRITACIVFAFLLIGNGLLRTPPKEEKPAYPLPRLDLAKYSKEMGYVFAAGGTFLTMLIIYYPVMYLDLLALERGVNSDVAFNMIIALSLSGIIGRVGLGFASDIVGPWNLLMPVSGGLSLMLFTMCSIQGPISLGAYAFFYGIFAGAWLSLMVTALASLASRTSEAGTRVGLVLSVSSFGLLFSSLLQDGMLTHNHLWALPSVVAGFLLVGVTGLAYMSRNMIAATKPASSRRRLKMLKDIPILKNVLIL